MSVNVIKAAQETLKLVVYLPEDKTIDQDAWCNRPHVKWMLHEIVEGRVRGEKAHRWLGWAQCCVYMFGGAESDTLKKINREAKFSEGSSEVKKTLEDVIQECAKVAGGHVNRITGSDEYWKGRGDAEAAVRNLVKYTKEG
jgi:hypothetical protein